jgi:large subunit ribosomal protein L6
MSRVANSPIALPKGVEVTIAGQSVTVKGPKGTLQHTVPGSVKVTKEADGLQFAYDANNPTANMYAGTTRAILNNHVRGVSAGFEKKLELVGVGYRAQAQGKKLNLTLGFSHPVDFAVPAGITIETPSQTEIVVKGADRQQVGQVAAVIRSYRSPDPYKGKGVRYTGEQIVLKEAKKK